MPLILLTNVNQYTGPGALRSLVQAGHTVLCHDTAFRDASERAAFGESHGSVHALEAQTPADIHAEVIARWGVPDGIVLNDVHPNMPCAIEDIPVDRFHDGFESLVVTPVRLTQFLLTPMKERGSGAFVFVTSAREQSPEPGFAVATTLRAATTAFARAVAREAAPFGIQANVVAPNFLHSEMYYPRALFVDDPKGRKAIARLVPMGSRRKSEP